MSQKNYFVFKGGQNLNLRTTKVIDSNGLKDNTSGENVSNSRFNYFMGKTKGHQPFSTKHVIIIVI